MAGVSYNPATMAKQLPNIRAARKAAKLTQDQVAKHLGISRVSVTQWELGQTKPDPERLPKLAKLLNVTVDYLLDSEISTEEFHGIDTKSGQPIREGVRMVAVKCHVEAGYFSDSPEWPQDDWYTIPVPNDPEFQNVNLYGAETRGPSMNKRYIEGSVVIFTSLIETDEAVLPGRRYIIERRDGAEYEATVKMLHEDDDKKLWLVPESTDPRYQEALELKENGEQEFRIVGRVVGSYQKES